MPEGHILLTLVEAYGKHLHHRYDNPGAPSPSAGAAPARSRGGRLGPHRPGHLQAHPGAVGAALLDQSVIAGAGNVFRAEALFAAGLHPELPASSLRPDDFDRLWSLLVAMMRRAVDDNQIVTRMVYKQPHCRRCETPVIISTVGGRTAYACPTCQPI